MKSLKTLVFAALAGLCLAAPARAGQQCDVHTDKDCDVRKYSWCGPVDLNYWVNEQGQAHCERALVTLTPTEVLPSLRRIRCYFYGGTTDLLFTAKNYVAVQGPKPGERIPIRNGVGEAIISGQYKSMSEDSVISFENTGPAGSIVVKCNGYGPA